MSISTFLHSRFAKTLLLTSLLPITVFAAKQVIDLRSSAQIIPANLSIDTQTTQGPLSTSLWQNFSQGGEEPRDMLLPVLPQVKALHPQVIRLDHLFDYFNVYQGPNNFNFEELDPSIKSIQAAGAIPLLSLSYVPANLSVDAQVNSEPNSWDQWSSLVEATAKHYSQDLGIANIYYEVGNEPDLFGHWHYAKSPNYLKMYQVTSQAVARGAGKVPYFIGGPATTNFYSAWITSLLSFCQKNNLPIDFISWHHYAKDPQDFEKNLDKLNSILANYPQYSDLQRLITEIGINSEPDLAYDNQISAIHTLATINQLSGKVHRIFNFELVDGPTKRSNGSGGWGLLTNPLFGSKPKPRYQAVQFVNQLSGQKLAISGQGNYVTAQATRTNFGVIQLLLVNYDPKGEYTQAVPLTFRQLIPGTYELKTSHLFGQTSTQILNSRGTYLEQTVLMEPNTALLLELTKQP